MTRDKGQNNEASDISNISPVRRNRQNKPERHGLRGDVQESLSRRQEELRKHILDTAQRELSPEALEAISVEKWEWILPPPETLARYPQKFQELILESVRLNSEVDRQNSQTAITRALEVAEDNMRLTHKETTRAQYLSYTIYLLIAAAMFIGAFFNHYEAVTGLGVALIGCTGLNLWRSKERNKRGKKRSQE